MAASSVHMSLEGLETFVLIAQTGSFNSAAKSLHIAQPSVTHRIQNLEEHVGVPLFDRLPRGVRLTPAGQRLLPYAEAMLDCAVRARGAALEAAAAMEATGA